MWNDDLSPNIPDDLIKHAYWNCISAEKKQIYKFR